MVIQSMHGDVEVEAEGKVMANPEELQVGVKANQHEAIDLKEITRSISSPFTRHTVSTHHTFKDTKEAFIRAVSLKLGEYAQNVRRQYTTSRHMCLLFQQGGKQYHQH